MEEADLDDDLDNVDVVGDNRSLAVSVRTKGYDALSQHTLNCYKRWDKVVEPHRTTYIEMKGCVAKNTGGIFWEITYKPDADPSLDAQVLLPRRPGGCDLHVNFNNIVSARR